MADRKLTVWGDKDFTITVPEDAKVTFGPFSPPTSKGYSSGGNRGTLRIYKGTKTTENVVAVFAGVEGFRDESLDYEEASTKSAPMVRDVVYWAHLEDEEKKELVKLLAEQLSERAIEEDEEKSEELPF